MRARMRVRMRVHVRARVRARACIHVYRYRSSLQGLNPDRKPETLHPTCGVS